MPPAGIRLPFNLEASCDQTPCSTEQVPEGQGPWAPPRWRWVSSMLAKLGLTIRTRQPASPPSTSTTDRLTRSVVLVAADAHGTDPGAGTTLTWTVPVSPAH